MLKKCVRQIFPLVLFTAMVICTPASVHAGGGGGDPSESNCNKVGKINVKCYVKSTSTYEGMITVDSKYWTSGSGSGRSCVYSYSEIRDKCSAAYGIEKNDLGFYYEYHIGAKKWSQHVPKKSEWGN